MTSSPADIATLLREGRAHLQAGRAAAAEQCFRAVLRHTPEQPDALRLLGLLAGQAGRHAEAAGFFRRGLAHDPADAALLYHLGESQEQQGDVQGADAAYAAAIAARPDFLPAYRKAAELAARARAYAAARGQGGIAEALRRGEADYRRGLAAQLGRAGFWAEAEAVARLVLALLPGDIAAQHLLGQATAAQGRPSEAAALLRQALTRAPERAGLHDDLGNALLALGDIEAAARAYEAAQRLDPGRAAARPDIPTLFFLTQHYAAETTAASLLASHRAWGDRVAAPAPPFANARDPTRRLRVGYLSPDLRHHPVSCFLEPLLARHDPAAVEAVCYAEVEVPDATSERLRALVGGRWRATSGLDNAALRALLRADGIDIAIDLAGHTRGNRLRALAVKPAPVTASWLGYPGTTGLPGIDWRITDALADPIGQERFHSERLMRLPDGFLCYQPPAEAPAVAPLPALASGSVTFGSFNTLPKLSDATIACWAGILAALPDARLLLKTPLLADEVLRRRLAERFAAAGVAAARLILRGPVAGTAGHLAAYDAVDIALDPFPYNGTTTSCESLWMGVPVVALIGERHAGRVGVDLLSRLDLAELAAPDPAAYGAIAVALARDLPALARRRTGLRDRVRGSILCDAPRFARGFERALRVMWANWCATG